MDQGTTIRTARAHLRMTQASLATSAGVSVNTVKRAEAGLPLQDETIRGLCAVLGLDATDFPRTVPDAPPEAEAARSPTPPDPRPAPAYVPAPWFGEWTPPPSWGPRLLAAGFASLVGLPFAVGTIRWATGARPAIATAPPGFEWLDPASVNMWFSAGMIFVLMIFTGYGILRGIIETAGDKPCPYPLTDLDMVRTSLACIGCFTCLTPVFQPWTSFQYLAMLLVGGGAGDAVLTWFVGWFLIALQVYLFLACARLARPFLRFPPLWPIGLWMAYLILSSPVEPMGPRAVAVAMLLGLSGYVSIRYRPDFEAAHPSPT